MQYMQIFSLENIGILKPPEVLNFLCMKSLADFKDHHIVTKLSCLDLTWFGTIVLNQDTPTATD